ncbi:hypothetical protein ABT297_03930 [Dactylosporangium sp. NPDC000555]|uniref:hypothetical protein n=1 Tax=Dactylosporangium sp. NPDC000555 TaxID=3154260 RepID=UPI0033299447
MQHMMSPTAVAILLMLALVIDYMSFGPNSIRDRIAFCLATPAIAEGFNAGPLERWTVGLLAGVIDQGKTAAGDSYIAGADTNTVIGAMVGILFIYTLGVLMPDKWSNRLGPWARLAFSKNGAVAVAGPGPAGARHRLNWRLWTCAALLGVLCELPQGAVGELMRSFISLLDSIAAPLPAALFGGG